MDATGRKTLPTATGGPTDFDFLQGRWTVHHRQARRDAAGWNEFAGEMRHHRAFGGRANVEEYDMQGPGQPYQALAIRAYVDVSRQWSIWWLDSRYPNHGMGNPVRGGFDGGVGLFYAEEEGPPGELHILRFRWERDGLDAARWEQAVSTDGGTSWEANWIMEFTAAD